MGGDDAPGSADVHKQIGGFRVNHDSIGDFWTRQAYSFVGLSEGHRIGREPWAAFKPALD
jgi:hypothetical protein